MTLKFISQPYRYLFGMFFLLLLMGFLFRLILLLHHTGSIENDFLLLLLAFVHGVRFDISVSCYALMLPFLLLSVSLFSGRAGKYLHNISHALLLLFFLLLIFISSADIPYFNHFHFRISTAAFLWAEHPWFTVGMIAEEFSYWIYLVLAVAVFYFFYKLSSRLRNIFLLQNSSGNISLKNIFLFLIFSGLLFLGARGRIAEKSPLRTGTAYFSSNGFLNQLALNPVFNFMSSAIEDMKEENKQIHLMEDAQAIALVKESMNISSAEVSPVCRKIISSEESTRMNLVLVIMERMSEFYRGKYNGPRLTPVLDSIAEKSLSFENIFTSGIHTFNGIFSTLFSYPAILKKHPMLTIPQKKIYALPAVLKENNYENIFFITHDGQFDNASGFLIANGFDKVYDESDYPSEKIKSTLGVPDDFMFAFSIPKLNKVSESEKNFFCGFMTGSNHKPYIFPEWTNVKYKADNDDYRMVEYCDWAIGQFLKKASKEKWYSNTIFVFVADHGAALGHTYDMPLSYHHTPLIIYAPGMNLNPQRYDCLGGQIDIFPTLMGLMNFSYVNNTMGIDLLKENRPFIYFSADDKIGCMDKEYYFIHRLNGVETLFRYENLSAENLLAQYPAKADSMRNYAFAMLQTAQWISRNEKFGPPERTAPLRYIGDEFFQRREVKLEK